MRLCKKHFHLQFLLATAIIVIGCVPPEEEPEAFDPSSVPEIVGECHVDRYEPDEQTVTKMDILIVPHTSNNSLQSVRNRVAQQIDSLTQNLPDYMDYNIGVMLAHGPESAHYARLYKRSIEPTILSRWQYNMVFLKTFLTLKMINPHQDPDTDGGEMGMHTLYGALNDQERLEHLQDQGMFREDAGLVVIFVADENDICAQYPEGVVPAHNPSGIEAQAYQKHCIDEAGNPIVSPQILKQKLKAVKGNMPFTINAVVYNNPATVPLKKESEYGHGYMDLIKLVNGVSVDLALGNYRKGLAKIASLATSAISPENSFQLQFANVDEQSIEAYINEDLVEHTYDAQLNLVEFLEPRDQMTVASIHYCQKAPEDDDPQHGGDDEQTPQGESLAITAGGNHTCVILNSGDVKCWGDNQFGQLGLGHTQNVGATELPSSVGTIDLGGEKVAQLSAGLNHTCALMASGDVRCWGQNHQGQLGLGHTENIGDDELPSSVPVVSLGARALKVFSGFNSNCAVLEEGQVICWGNNQFGQLGLGHTDNIGDDELPIDAGYLQLGDSVVQMDYSTISFHACAILSQGDVKCWGRNNAGQLGLGHTENIGDDELPSSIGTLPLGNSAIQLATGNQHTCALLSDGSVKCWGSGAFGILGYGNTNNIGDTTTIENLDSLDFGTDSDVSSITAGNGSSCVLFDNARTKCWGSGAFGQLGQASTEDIGDYYTPADIDYIKTSDLAKAITVGVNHTCILGQTQGRTQCWGRGIHGATGYATTQDIGDTEYPEEMGFVSVINDNQLD